MSDRRIVADRRIIYKKDVDPNYLKLVSIFYSDLESLLKEVGLVYSQWPWRRIKSLPISNNVIWYTEKKKILGLIPYTAGHVVGDILLYQKNEFEIRVFDSKFNDAIKNVANKLENKLKGEYVVRVSAEKIPGYNP